jgi:hypothetical protein
MVGLAISRFEPLMQTKGLQELNRGGSAYTSLHSMNVFGKADTINLPNCTYLNVAQQNFPIPSC